MRSYTERYIHVVELDEDTEQYLDEYREWCLETFGKEGNRWVVQDDDLFNQTRIRFLSAADRDWFLLRWAGVK